MLTSAKRKILNIVCIMMAIASLSYGLVLKYATSPSDDVLVQEKPENNEELITVEHDIVFTSNDLMTNQD